MNKYEEALDFINTLICCSCEEQVTEKEMPCFNCDKIKKIHLLQELINKQTLKKVNKEKYEPDYSDDRWVSNIYECPTCGNNIIIDNNYCPYCGQKLDWKD